MKAFPLRRFLLAILLALLLISCGSSGGGIGGSGVTSQGSITGFGSIVVNGTEFDTTNATIIVEGEEAGVVDLHLGMVVTVYGTDGKSAVANRVVYNDNVEGPVKNIVDNGTSKQFEILNQTVIVNFITEFKGTDFNAIAEDDVVEVSGFVDDMGVIWATFLEKTDGLVFEVTGFVENLDTGSETFKINDLTVDYSAADTSGLPGGEPVEGLFVEVEGTLAAGDLRADVIELGDELEVEDAGEIEVTGFVTEALAPNEFTVGNQVVHTDINTVFVDGTPLDIAPGKKLEAEGRLIGGILFAWEIEFWEPDQVEVEGEVTAISSPTEFTVGAQDVRTNGTIFEPPDLIIEENINLEVKGVWEDISRSVLIADKVSLEED
ncbi:MAG: DUF5666 domain-containing protein [Syntrophobacterales bacterium]|jgi:hypothetical protein